MRAAMAQFYGLVSLSLCILTVLAHSRHLVPAWVPVFFAVLFAFFSILSVVDRAKGREVAGASKERGRGLGGVTMSNLTVRGGSVSNVSAEGGSVSIRASKEGTRIEFDGTRMTARVNGRPVQFNGPGVMTIDQNGVQTFTPKGSA